MVTQAYFQKNVKDKSHLCKEMELIKIYNGGNFDGFPEYVDDVLGEIDVIPDVKF